MLTYKIGLNAQSKTSRQVLITIKTLASTNMSSFTEDPTLKYPCFLTDFYLSYCIDAGQIVKITDLNEKETFTTATIHFGGEPVEFQLNKYFKITNPDLNCADARSISVYKFRVAARQSVDYISCYYTGVYYTHYPNGTIKDKTHYTRGVPVNRSVYRNDTFNTIQCAIVYNGKVPETEYLYDDRENLVKRNIYDATGKLLQTFTY